MMAKAIFIALILAFIGAALAFSPAQQGKFTATRYGVRSSPLVVMSTTEEPTEKGIELKSDMGMDYVPLENMLMAADWEGADQFTRDALIKIAGPTAVKTGFVYFTQVKNIPTTDLHTIERLWKKHSDGKFGYSEQRKIWDKQGGDFDKFCEKIGWKIQDGDNLRLRKWFGKSEFIYDLNEAPKGHFPLTSALRGVTLLKELLTHPAWDDEEFAARKRR